MKEWNASTNRKMYGLRILITALTVLCVLLCMSVTAGAATNKGSDIRLTKTTGTVTIQTAAGKNVSVKEGMKLLSGYVTTTGAKSYAWITIDSTKAVKMNACSKVKIKQSGGKLEIQLLSGASLVNVSKKLTADESLDIRTSTTVTGIRGTAIYTEKHSETEALNASVEGTGVTTITDPDTGEEKTLSLPAGTSILSSTGNDSGTGEGNIQVEVNQLPEEDIPGFVAVEVAENQNLADRMAANTSYNVTEIISNAEERLAQDEAKAEAQQQELEQKAAEETTPKQTEVKQETASSSGGGGGGGGSSSDDGGYVSDPTPTVNAGEGFTRDDEGSYVLTYDGDSHALIQVDNTSRETLKYKLVDSNTTPENAYWTSNVEEMVGTNAGTYSVYYGVCEGNEDPTEALGPITVEITKVDVPSDAYIAPVLKESVAVDQELLSNKGNVDSGFTMKYFAGTDGTTSSDISDEQWNDNNPTVSEAGTYYVWYKVEDTDGIYNPAVARIGPVEVTAEQPNDGKLVGYVTAPEGASGLTYNGNSQRLLATGATDATGDVWYCFREANSVESDPQWSQDIPTATNAGTYYIWYKVDESDEYEAVTEQGPIEVTIAPADITQGENYVSPSVTGGTFHPGGTGVNGVYFEYCRGGAGGPKGNEWKTDASDVQRVLNDLLNDEFLWYRIHESDNYTMQVTKLQI